MSSVLYLWHSFRFVRALLSARVCCHTMTGPQRLRGQERQSWDGILVHSWCGQAPAHWPVFRCTYRIIFTTSHLNDCQVVRWIAARGRYGIKLDDGGTNIAVKPANLLPLLQAGTCDIRPPHWCSVFRVRFSPHSSSMHHRGNGIDPKPQGAAIQRSAL